MSFTYGLITENAKPEPVLAVVPDTECAYANPVFVCTNVDGMGMRTNVR